MFHSLFLTKIDRSYHVECFYVQYDKEVSQSYDVSILPSIDLKSSNLNEEVHASREAAAPTCKYEVLHGGPSGSPLKYAKIGDVVYHKWSCSHYGPGGGPSMCMTVHSCVVDDGRGRGQQLIDERGCTRDSVILENLKYRSNLEAGQSSTVFRFADRTTVFFSCQIRIERMEDTEDKCSHDFSFCGETEGIRVIDAPLRTAGPIDTDFPRPTELPVMSENAEQFFEGKSEEEGEEKGIGEMHVGTTSGFSDPLTDAPDKTAVSVDQNRSGLAGSNSPAADSPVPQSDLSVEENGGYRRKRKRLRESLWTPSNPLRPPLKLIDLLEHDSSRVRFRRSPSHSSIEIDVSTESIEVSDEPLFEMPRRDGSTREISIDNRTGEVCLSKLAFSMLILSTILIIAIISMIYWIYAFRRMGTSGRITRFVENYWIEAETANPSRYQYSNQKA